MPPWVHCRAVMDVDVSVGGFGVGSWRLLAAGRTMQRGLCVTTTRSQVSLHYDTQRYVPKYFYLSTRKARDILRYVISTCHRISHQVSGGSGILGRYISR